jgi:hypothetical protein
MDWNQVAIVFGVMVVIFAILGVVKISKKREAAEDRAEEEHQKDLTDLPDGHSYHYSAEEAHRKELAGTPGQAVALKKEPETSSQILVSSKPPVGVSVEMVSPAETLPESTPEPIAKPNKPIRKHRKK